MGMRLLVVGYLLLLLLVAAADAAGVHGASSQRGASWRQNFNTSSTAGDSPYLSFLRANRMQTCSSRPVQPQLPRSYFAPSNYFDDVPSNLRIPTIHQNKQPEYVTQCGRIVTGAALDDYEFATERYLTSIGLNVYDGAVWSMAFSVLENYEEAISYETMIVSKAETCHFSNLKADAACQGVEIQGQCPPGTNCGFCYGTGSNSERTLPTINAFIFRMISDYWSLQGTIDPRCPEQGFMWTWNDYRPVLGENSWAYLLGPLQVAFIKWGSAISIPENDISIQMALNFLPSLLKLMTPIGAVGYSPKNVLSWGKDHGFDVSTENNISLLAGLKMLREIFSKKGIHLDKLADINNLIIKIETYIKTSYDPSLGYFRQGGSFDINTGTFTWATGSSGFAVDCQTWAMSVINPLLIDQWFGTGASIKIWQKTKQLGGFSCSSLPTGYCAGVGFTDNTADQVFSGEWTLGAINMLRIFAGLYPSYPFNDEATFMLNSVTTNLVQSTEINGVPVQGVLYANKRYWIPFGWWANPLLSTVSTSWTVLVENNFNPFYLGGKYLVDY